MKKTGRINRLTGEDILQVEESDINWKNSEYVDLSLDEKADICSMFGIPFLNSDIEHIVIERYNKLRDKNLNL